MNLVSLFLRFVKGQFKDDQVMYGFHKRMVTNRTDDFVEDRKKIVCDGVEIDYTGHYKNNGIK